MKEIWKDIPDYEGYYQVSNLGRVKSLPRKTNNQYGSRTIKERILKTGISRGYLTTALYKDGKRKAFTIHQLVAMAFLNHTPCGYKIVVDHIDNNPKNNRVDNLQLTNPRHNCSKDRKNVTSKYTGVSWHKRDKLWYSYICIKGVNKYIGRFNTEIEAHEAYQNALNNIIK